jgi:spermidine synthase
MTKDFSFWQKIKSYFYPIMLQRVNSKFTDGLVLYFYRGELNLSNEKATYSAGIDYTPFKKSFHYLHQNTQLDFKSFLLLGAGMCSAVQILDRKYNMHPETTIVDIDPAMITLSELYIRESLPNLHFITADANEFIQQETKKYECIGVDLFSGLLMPDFLLTTLFWESIKKISSKNGIVIINSIFNTNLELQEFTKLVEQFFVLNKCIQNDKNSIYIFRNTI